MTEITLALCKSAFSGLAVWLAGMCASNQALDSPEVDLAKEGEVLRQQISISMNERYKLVLKFTFESRKAFEASTVAGRPGSGNAKACSDEAAYDALSRERKAELGATLEFGVVVSSADGKTTPEAIYQSRCIQSWGELSKTRHLGYIDLSKGRHQLVVVNRKPARVEPGVRVSLLLVGVGAGLK